MKRVIILSQGRSGSTLVQRVLTNSVPNCFISGENGGFWNYIYDSYRAFLRIDEQERVHAKHNNCDPYTYFQDNYKPAWTNLYTTESLLEHYRNLFDDMYCAEHFDVIGFKEIRVHDDLDGFIAFMKLLFPDIYFVSTVRHIDSIIKSGWWKPQDRRHLMALERRLTDNRSTYTIHYEKINEDSLKQLCEHLGVTVYTKLMRQTLKNKTW